MSCLMWSLHCTTLKNGRGEGERIIFSSQQRVKRAKTKPAKNKAHEIEHEFSFRFWGKVSVSIFTRAFRVLIEHYPIRHAVNANWLSMIRQMFMVFYLWIWLVWATDRAGFMMRLGTKRSTGIFWVWGFRWIIMVFDINFDVISNENKRKKNLALILVKTRENIFFNWIDTSFFRWILF